MSWIDQDPTNVPCPDFAGAAYTAIRQIMSNNRQINNNKAVKQLTTAWNQTHMQEVEAWNQQVQMDLDERREQEKKKPKINDFDKGKMVADHIMPRPSQFAIGKLKSFNFVELWYFTDEGCAEAQDTSKACVWSHKG